MSTARTIPVWRPLGAFSQQAFRAAGEPADADVLVIGAGVAGLVTALCLLREGRKVVVIDREGVAEGETGRSTAHLASALDDRFYELARLHGADGARLAAASHAAAIDWIEDFVAGHPERCGFRRIPGYLFPHDGDDSRLRRELDAARCWTGRQLAGRRHS